MRMSFNCIFFIEPDWTWFMSLFILKFNLKKSPRLDDLLISCSGDLDAAVDSVPSRIFSLSLSRFLLYFFKIYRSERNESRRMRLKFSAAALFLLNFGSSESLQCIRCNRKGFISAQLCIKSWKIPKKAILMWKTHIAGTRLMIFWSHVQIG